MLLAVAEILVAAREVLDEVADGGSRPKAARRRATAGVTCSRSASGRARLEGSKERRGDRRPLVVPAAAEAMREWLPGHSTIIANAAVPGPMCVPTTAATWPWNTKWELGRMRSIISRMSGGSSSLIGVDGAEVELVVGLAALLDEALHGGQGLLEAAHLGVAGQRAVDGDDQRLDVEDAADEARRRGRCGRRGAGTRASRRG